MVLWFLSVIEVMTDKKTVEKEITVRHQGNEGQK
jgi:hypothetical protein